MVAKGYFDTKLAILKRVWTTTGPDLPIAVTMDFTANIHAAMVELAPLAVGYDTYPRVNLAERAFRLAHGATPIHIREPHPSSR